MRKEWTIIPAFYLLLFIAYAPNFITQNTITTHDAYHLGVAYEASKGMPLYPSSPSPYVTPANYTPLVPHILGRVIAPFNYSPVAAKLFTLLCSLGALYILTIRLSSPFYKLVVPLLAVSVPGSTPWYVDTSINAYLFFFLFAAWVLDREEMPALAHLCLWLAFWCKQTAAIIIVCHLAGVFIQKRQLRLCTVVFLVNALIVLGCNIYTSGGFFDHILYSRHHPILWERILTKDLWREVFGHAGLLIFAFLSPKKPDLRRMCFLVPSLVMATVFRSKYGSGVVMGVPFYVFLALSVCETMRCNKSSLIIFTLQLLAFFPTHLVGDKVSGKEEETYLKIVSRMKEAGTPYWENRGFINVVLGRPFGHRVSMNLWKDGRISYENYPKAFLDFFRQFPYDVVVLNPYSEDSSLVFYASIRKSGRYELEQAIEGHQIWVKKY